MGFKTEFNWALKLKPENGLDELKLAEDKVFSFTKEEYRIYPMDIPIDLLNENWEAVARVVVIESTTAKGRTYGKYKVLWVYSDDKKELLTEYWRKRVEHIKGEKIVDFKNVKVT